MKNYRIFAFAAFLLFLAFLYSSQPLPSSPGPGSASVFVDDVGEHDIASLKAVLSSHGISATYSVIPGRLTPEVAEQLKGERTCLHGYYHNQLEFTSDYETAAALLESGQKRMNEMGLFPKCFRPPWDRLSPEAELAIRDAGLELIPHSEDFFFNNPAPVETAYIIMARHPPGEELVFSLHMPLDEKTLKAVDTLLEVQTNHGAVG